MAFLDQVSTKVVVQLLKRKDKIVLDLPENVEFHRGL
jgi:hypothetical protein